MTSFSDLLQQGSSNLWLFIPSALLLGALHGLEPGHSKTMMAAFIIAIRGTVMQAVLLGVSAAASHTLVVWLVALVGLHYGAQIDGERTEAWFQLASGALIVTIAVWMLLRIHGQQQASAKTHSHHDHHHGGDHDHGHDHEHADDHGDDHARAHAADIEQRFGDRRPSTGQIIAFGLTGGLVPCPASITVLLLCLQLKKYSLGLTLVLGFSIGLALVMVLSGVLAALSLRAASNRWGGFSGFGVWARRAPYLSSALIIVIGLISIQLGWDGLQQR
ncbi:nickel/cobalt efflux transporter [uncultured Nevskia sp.]|uniref:nickel/cobalt efflux transporter n=1 Tax=uncultured Nevskia sp. TaxID=228950 RepID=UPI0025D83463|nr:nickel/cobalt efflux transporter [uncultured Nevskia sp.]